MRKIKCSRDAINKAPLKTLGAFFSNVRVSLFGLPDQFPNPTVTQDNMKLLTTDLSDAASQFKSGGDLKKPDYTNVISAIKKMLNTIADYVDEVANGDKDIIKMAGMVPTGQKKIGDKAIKAKYKVSGVAGKRLNATMIETTCDALGAEAIYTCVVSEDNPLTKEAVINAAGQLRLPKNIPNIVHIDSSNQKTKKITDLTPRTHYYITYFVRIGKVITQMSDVVEVW